MSDRLCSSMTFSLCANPMRARLVSCRDDTMAVTS
jgi:hypothetical protein